MSRIFFLFAFLSAGAFAQTDFDTALKHRLLDPKEPLLDVQVYTASGIDPDAKEAVAFAILAWRTWRRLPSNVPSATGARHGAVLGKISW